MPENRTCLDKRVASTNRERAGLGRAPTAVHVGSTLIARRVRLSLGSRVGSGRLNPITRQQAELVRMRASGDYTIVGPVEVCSFRRRAAGFRAMIRSQGSGSSS
ncbi:hypothetical protein [Actinomadura rupiterrae]|uniref:hypothetical protein n=1 Tax=Actinomadura rupiterrae TaxID=559627 RepID=UPI0020A25C7B|nr:hypothetical protein [Actinomadura rupiterrae]MCP2342141.1 hypothetical protein [Actinomadura rupiterrae]